MRSGRDFDWLVLITTFALCFIGLSLIYSVLHPHGGNGSAETVSYLFFQRQLIWIAFGVVALLVGFIVPFRIYETLAFVGYFVCLAMLVALMFIKGGQGINRWITLGSIKLQPSEFTKVALLLVWGRILAGQRAGSNRLRKILWALGVAGIPFLLVLKQPDLGTAMIFTLMLLPVLYWRGVRGHQILFIVSPLIAGLLILYGEDITQNPWPFGIYIVVIFIIAYLRRSNLLESISLVGANLGVALILPVVWDRLKEYQQHRILNFLAPESDKLGAGWQVFQSKIAIGSGGITGKGYLEGTQKALEFLPAKHTDFVFSVLGEEMGFIGAVLVLFLFTILIFRALAIAEKSKSEFASTVCIGIAAYFFFQVMINVAMTTGMAPVTGIPLPFLSYGGSSMVISCFFVGFLLNCSTRWYEY